MSKSEAKQISLTKKAEIVARAVVGLAALNPTWGLLFGFAAPLIGLWDDFGQERINEQAEFIERHRDEFKKEIIEGDDFKTLFLNVLERHMKEASEEKRKLLRNYLLNVGKGINPGFNEFTRMNNVMDTITLYEIDMLRLWDEDGPIETWYRNTRPVGTTQRIVTTIETLQTYIRDMKPRDEGLMKLIDEPNKSKNNQTLLLLGYKGLLYVLADNNFGSGQEARIQEITDFGKAFLAFIKV
jgi:hypothetical protein